MYPRLNRDTWIKAVGHVAKFTQINLQTLTSILTSYETGIEVPIFRSIDPLGSQISPER